jgi:putative endonuclease
LNFAIIATLLGEQSFLHDDKFEVYPDSCRGRLVAPQKFNKMYFVYIIESSSSGKWYYGYTHDLNQRLEAHNSGRNISTASRGPWSYIFQRPFASDKEARSFETYLKKSRNKQYLRAKFSEYFRKAGL